MTGFSFLHAADLHLGSPLRGLALKDAVVARRFAEASRQAFSTLVTRAIEASVAFVVIAGDIYDGDWRDNSIGLYFNRELARLDRAGIEVFLLRGNHDAESVITRSVTLPASVRHFGNDAPTTFRIERLKVALHGQGFAQRAVTDNLVMNYPGQIPGWFNIGVLHTALMGRPDHDNYAPCSPGHLRARGYDYWALGHIHEFEVVGERPHIIYPGNLQGRHIRESGPKGAVLVSVNDGEVARIERVIVDHARWEELSIDVRGAESEAEVLKTIEDKVRPLAGVAAERLVALRVVLSGETAIHRHLVARREQFADEVQAAAQRVDADIWLEKLSLRTRPLLTGGLAEPAMLSLDLSALLSQIETSPDLTAKAGELISGIKLRIPGTVAEDEQDFYAELPALIAEARELLLTRASGED
ncbi:MAG TPA: DNA repair exonuclease [Devosiaceae bacterium]|nr:DNA repair exonuclease [Devosiaceae bacterium]